MPINVSDPLGAKVRFALRGSEGVNEIISGTIPTGGTLSVVSTAGGDALVPSATETKWTFVNPDTDPYLNDVTYHWYGVIRDNTGQSFIDNQGVSYGYKTGTVAYSAGILRQYLFAIFAGSAQFADLVYGFTDGALHSIIIRYSGTTVDFYLDGTNIGTQTLAKEPGAMGAGQFFSITGDATAPHKHIVSTIYKGALDSTEIARLVADPFAAFEAGPIALTTTGATQSNTASAGSIFLPGFLTASSSTQTNTASAGAVTSSAPPFDTVVDLSDPLGAKARFVLRASEGPNELLTGTAPTGATLPTTSTAGGVAFAPTASETRWTLLEPETDPYNNDVTYHWYGVIRDDADQNLLSNNGTPYSYLMGSSIRGYGAGVFSFYLYNAFIGLGQYADLNYGFADGNLHSIIIRYSGTTLDFYLDGTHIGTQTLSKEPGTIGPSQFFSITGHATKPHKHIVSTIYKGALDSTEIARLVADPFAIFIPPPVTLTGGDSAQPNAASTGYVLLTGSLLAPATSQENSVSSGSVSLTQTLTVANAVQVNAVSSGTTDAYRRLRALMKPVQKGEWLQVNVGTFIGTHVPTADDHPGYGVYTHYAVANAWPGFAWDDTNGELILWGGGHANYAGNEVYIWSGETGNWRLGSLPSALDAEYFVIDKAAPQSSHTYQNNAYLPNNKMFLTFAGAAYPNGGPIQERTGSSPTTWRYVLPWVFDLSKADSTKVGGTTGSGWDTTDVKLGSNAWYNRTDFVDVDPSSPYGFPFGNNVNGATAIVDEGGVDVAYITTDNSSGLPFIVKYTFGDIRAGGRDNWKVLGRVAAGVIGEGWGAWDTVRSMFYRNSYSSPTPGAAGYGAPDMVAVRVPVANFNAPDVGIYLRDSDGNQVPCRAYPPAPADAWDHQNGVIYNPDDDKLYLWNGWETNTGEFWTVDIPAYDPVTGWASTTWLGTKHTPTGAVPPGHHLMSILGRMKYVKALKTIAIISQPTGDGTVDASVWMLKTTDAEMDLTADAPTQGNSASTVGITLSLNLTAAAESQPNTVTAVAISQGQDLTSLSVTQGNTLETGVISKGYSPFLVCAPSVQDNVAAASAIVQAHMLAAANLTQSNTPSTGAVDETGGGALHLFAAACLQSNAALSAAATQGHKLIGSNCTQPNKAKKGAVNPPPIAFAAHRMFSVF